MGLPAIVDGVRVFGAGRVVRGTIGLHKMVGLSGGWVAIGRKTFSRRGDGTVYETILPSWRKLSSFSIGTTAVTTSQFASMMGGRFSKGAYGRQPVRWISYDKAREYIRVHNERDTIGPRLLLPSSDQWEAVARGLPVDLREVAQREGVRPSEIPTWMKNRYENAFAVLGGPIFPSGRDQGFLEALAGGLRLWAYRVYATPSGAEEVHRIGWGQNRRPFSVDWGEPNEFGVHGLGGGLKEWTTRYHPLLRSSLVELRGGATLFSHGRTMANIAWEWEKDAFDRGYSGYDYAYDTGFRVASRGVSFLTEGGSSPLETDRPRGRRRAPR